MSVLVIPIQNYVSVAGGVYGNSLLPVEQSGPWCSGICPGGTWCSGATVEPRRCLPGSYCSPGSSAPQPCPAKTFGNGTSLATAAECSECVEGHACVTGSGLPEACATGTYQDQARQDSCKRCEVGTSRRPSHCYTPSAQTPRCTQLSLTSQTLARLQASIRMRSVQQRALRARPGTGAPSASRPNARQIRIIRCQMRRCSRIAAVARNEQLPVVSRGGRGSKTASASLGSTLRQSSMRCEGLRTTVPLAWKGALCLS